MTTALENLTKELEKAKGTEAWADSGKRYVKLQALVDEAKVAVTSKFDGTSEKLTSSLQPLLDSVQKSFAAIVEGEVARGESASEHLQKVSSDLTDSELKIAEDNSRLTQHVLKESFSTPDKDTMLANLVDNLHAQIAQTKAKKEEMVAAGGLDYLVQKLDEATVTTLRSLLVLLRKNPSDRSVLEQLKNLISAGAVPPPPNADVDLITYIQIVLRRSERADAKKEDCSVLDTCTTRTPCRTRFNRCEAMTDDQQCSAHTTMCTVFGDGKTEALLYENTLRLGELEKLLAETGLWQDKDVSTDAMYEAVKRKVEDRTVQASWLWKVNPSSTQEAAVTPEQKAWLQQSFKDHKSGALSDEQFYNNIMTEYNEGKITYEMMSRLTRRFNNNGKANTFKKTAGKKMGRGPNARKNVKPADK
jgi:hypothetical protein